MNKWFLIFSILFSLNLQGELFSIARLKYDGGDWYNDPSSIPNLLKFTEKQTGIKCNKIEPQVSLLEDNVFSYPFLFLTGHGEIILTTDEIHILRAHLLNGGFLFADDDFGMDKSFRSLVKKLFPNRKLIAVPFNHQIYNIKYKFKTGLPKIHKHTGKPPQGLGIFVDGRLVLFYSYESNLADGWADKEVHNDPQKKRILSLEMGCNLILNYLNN